MDVTPSARRLFELLSTRGDKFTRHLVGGRPRDQIQSLLARRYLPSPPTEVVSFYESFDLVDGYQYGPDQPTFYGIYWLLSLADAIDLWAQRRSYDFLEPRLREAFPLLQEDANVYVVDSLVDDAGNHRVIHDFSGVQPEAEFLSMATLFDTFHEWLTSGALPDGRGTVPGHYEGDPDAVAAVAARLNPGIDVWTAG